MADIRNLPVPDPAAPVVPELPIERVQRLEAEVEDLRAENQRLRAYLNDVQKLTQRVLALRAGRERLLLLILIAAAVIYASLPGTYLNRVLVDAWNQLFSPPHAHAQTFVPPRPLVVPVGDPTDVPPAVAVPSPRTPLSPPPAAAPPIVTKPSPTSSPSPTLPIHPCSVTNGKPPQCQPTPLTP